jgi:hypothetical protein
MEVSLNGADSDAIVEYGEDVVQAEAASDAPPPGAGLEDWTADLGSAAEDVSEGYEAIFLIAEDRASLRCEDAVIWARREKATFSLNSDVTVEVGGGADDRAGIDWLILDISYVAVDGMQIAVASVEIKA